MLGIRDKIRQSINLNRLYSYTNKSPCACAFHDYSFHADELETWDPDFMAYELNPVEMDIMIPKETTPNNY